ncbi:ABC-2 type transport system permease [Deinococcus grandis]|uniref:ABC-2 type transport system permease n=1 Tax=Deinococcus grandis TaxID=57498 RepID=A0A100HHQ9_9DEIO|nr:ABC transporter permease [Deinococcus grandis]BBN95546.1 ABC transporter permease [Deinococcus grandis]GAQ20966.1 ABC-2 type transport system permease [Deinococcus grandis]
MLTLLSLEFRKLFGARSVRLALLVTLLLPLLWAFAPRLDQLFAPGQAVALVSGWQLPFISIFTSIQFLLPLFIAVMAAEMIGAEVAHGTLAPLLLRPVDRTRVILSKLIVAITYPFILLLVTLLGSLIAGLPLGYGNFQGGTGLGAGGLVGVGTLTSEAAFGEVLRGTLLAGVSLMPIAALALLFGILYLNTAAAALATFATLIVMRLFVVLPQAIQPVLLTNYFQLFLPSNQDTLGKDVILLLIYTVGFGLLSIFAFDRRDV